MSALTVVTSGREDALKAIISSFGGDLELGLRTDTNPVTAGMTMSQITQPTWPGYAPIVPVPWAAVTAAANGDAQSQGTTVTFTNTGTTTTAITGYFLQNSVSGFLYAAVTLAAPVNVAANAQYQLTVTLTMGYCLAAAALTGILSPLFPTLKETAP
jgi:hypothetical protein